MITTELRTYTGPDRRKPVLIVQHAEHEHPAAVRRALESQGILTRWIHPYRGEGYPSVSEISGIISLGGPMGANDEREHPWILQECKLLRQCVESELPVVGICLGGQMLARAMGGRVERNHTIELGWFPIHPTPEGEEDLIIGSAGKSPTVYHWHGDTFHLPPGAILLAESQACSRQAYRLGDKVYGFQFHPEADHQLVTEWLSIDGVEDEIHEVQRAYGNDTIQDAATQRDRALKGERASLRITAGIGSLFRKKQRNPVSEEQRAKLFELATHRNEILLSFEGSRRRPVHLRGRISTILEIPGAEFVILQERDKLLWPIRTEDILEISVLMRK